MNTRIDQTALRQIALHHRSLGWKYRLKGMPYERCAELSWIIHYLKPNFRADWKYLDVGTGESPLPTFLRTNTPWDITCLDKYGWVGRQNQFLENLKTAGAGKQKFRAIEKDLFHSDMAPNSYDLITCISVIEHFEGNSDTQAMKAMARILTPGGTLILTTLMNDGHFAEFSLKSDVYGSNYQGNPVFYQRHYDQKAITRRLIEPSGLSEHQRIYFGDYGFQCFEKVMQRNKPMRALYAWNTPWLASRYMSYQPYPISRKEMKMNTASGVILVLRKPDQNDPNLR